MDTNSKHGQLYLIPSSIKTNEIARILREGYDPAALSDGYTDLLDALKLDYLIIDTHPGLNEETLLSIAISDVLTIIMRPDAQDYQGRCDRGSGAQTAHREIAIGRQQGAAIVYVG
ncbi:MAG: hypothetical protein R3E79_57865 [Caldilineaceae bacterium]